MAEAQQALEELQQMMENLRLSENNQGGEGGQSSAQGLADILQDQQICPTMRSMICSFSNPNGQEGQGEQNGESEQQQGQGEQQGSDFADRQGQLRERLENERSNIEGVLGEGRRCAALIRAGGSRHAPCRRALENGDLDGAVDQQAQAMDALRQGRDVNRAQRSENSDVQQGNSDQETGQGRDPLGRRKGRWISGTAGARRDGQDPEAQAAELLGDSPPCRRAGPQRKRTRYLKHLLDLF